MQESKYEIVWEQLKKDQKVMLQLNIDSCTSKEQVRKLVKCVRKGISHRKQVDTKFLVRHPSSRIEIKSANFETGVVTIVLVHMTPPFSLIQLVEEPK